MAGIKISALPPSATLGGTEELPVVQSGATVKTTVNDLALTPLAASGGSDLVGFLQVGTGAVATTVQSKLREGVSVTDFGAVGDGSADDTVAFQLALNSGAKVILVPTCSSFYKVTAPLRIPSNVRICGELPMGMTEVHVDVVPCIKKTTNTTVAITNWDTGAVTNEDCIFYTDFNYYDTNTATNGGSLLGYPPQGFGIEDLALVGAGSSTVKAGLYMDFGAHLNFINCTISGVTHGFIGRNVYLSSLRQIHTLGRITLSQTGTSLLIDHCSAQSGFYLTGLFYWTMQHCSCDGLTGASAYNFVSCVAGNVIACGAEAITPVDATTGVFRFATGNRDVNLSGCFVYFKAGSSSPAISIGDFDSITVLGGTVYDPTAWAPSAFDLYCAANSLAHFINTQFHNSTFLSNTPAITYAGGGVAPIVTVEYAGVTTVYTRGVGVITTPISGTWSPLLTINFATTGIAQVSTGTYTRQGNLLFASATITLSNKGALTGPVVVTQLPFTTPATSEAIVCIGEQANMAAAVNPCGYIPTSNSAIFLTKAANPANLLDDTDITNTTTLHLSITMMLT